MWITLILFSVSFIVDCRASLTRAINYHRQPCAPNSRCNHTIIEGFVERLTRGHAVIRVCPAALAASKKLTGGNSHLFYMPPNEIEATVKCVSPAFENKALERAAARSNEFSMTLYISSINPPAIVDRLFQPTFLHVLFPLYTFSCRDIIGVVFVISLDRRSARLQGWLMRFGLADDYGFRRSRALSSESSTKPAENFENLHILHPVFISKLEKHDEKILIC